MNGLRLVHTEHLFLRSLRRTDLFNESTLDAKINASSHGSYATASIVFAIYRLRQLQCLSLSDRVNGPLS